MKDGVFVCYRRKDVPALAGRVYDQLQTWFPGRAFMDVQGIAPGRDFRECLADVMDRCRVVVVLMGPSWQDALLEGHGRADQSDFVVSELE